jgi:hypothetical protein
MNSGINTYVELLQSNSNLKSENSIENSGSHEKLDEMFKSGMNCKCNFTNPDDVD